MADTLTFLKNAYSSCLLIFSIVLLSGLIFARQTPLSTEIHPAIAYLILWIAIAWLSVVEGAQASFVGLAPVNRELYEESHPLAFKCTSHCHSGDNLRRYLLGRQFMVVLFVFTVNLAGTPLPGAELWGLPQVVVDIFLVSSVAMILFTCMVGQLNSQVNAALCMLDYINSWTSLLSLYVAMIIEFSGILHVSYLIQTLALTVYGKKVESFEEDRNMVQNVFFWFRVAMSTALLCFSLAVTLEALFLEQTIMWDGTRGWGTLVLLFALMSVVGWLEGMQIAFFGVAKLPPSQRGTSECAKRTCALLFKGDGRNLASFTIGRQLCVVTFFFIIARITTPNVSDEEENIFGVNDMTQKFFNTGIFGVIITTLLGSLFWQLLASAFPIAFLSNPLTYVFLRMCLFLEATGIASGSWVLATIYKRIANFQRDEEYIGTAEERAKQNLRDNPAILRLGPGQPVKLPGFYESRKSLNNLIDLNISFHTIEKSDNLPHEEGEHEGATIIEESDSV